MSSHCCQRLLSPLKTKVIRPQNLTFLDSKGFQNSSRRCDLLHIRLPVCMKNGHCFSFWHRMKIKQTLVVPLLQAQLPSTFSTTNAKDISSCHTHTGLYHFQDMHSSSKQMLNIKFLGSSYNIGLNYNNFFYVNGCRPAFLLPLPLVLSTNLPCNKRFYSKDEFVTEDSTVTSKEDNKSDDGASEKPDESIRNDPWIKSLLADMKQDFDKEQHTQNDKFDNGDSDADIVKTEYKNVPSDESNNNSSHDVYEYDYRLADDDDNIEEFGYFDDSSVIGSTKPERNFPVSLDRSVNGVFELEELVTLMEHLGGENIVTVPIPPEANYCDHMVIITAKSKRHLQALNDDMLWVHKRKKSKKDPTLHIEGMNRSDWCALDLGNLVLHIFLNEEVRQYYDIETLWTLGPENDPKCLEHDQHSFALSAEDLYWMEVRGGKEPRVEEKSEGKP